MLRLVIKGEEFYNEEEDLFEDVDEVELELEHSLISLSKWESIHQIPFLTADEKTPEQIMSYIHCMVCTPDIDLKVLYYASQANLDKIHDYINSPQSATTFGAMPERRGRGEIITSELIYYWMVAFNIPFKCETWHLNRLFALVRICNVKQSKQKKMSRNEIAQRNRDLNAERKAKFGTSG